jgi:hypothetical protein
VIVNITECQCRNSGPHPAGGGRLTVRLGTPRDIDAEPPKAHQYRRRILEVAAVATSIDTFQSVTLTIDPASIKDRRGRPATLDGLPVWATDDSDRLTLTPSADGMSCVVATGGMPTTPGLGDDLLPKVIVTADGMPGPDVANFTSVPVAFEIKQTAAVTMTVGVGTPADLP